MASAPSAEWIEWAGGKCPVSDSALVDVQCRGETREEAEDEEPSPAVDWIWTHDGRPGEVVAYRVAA